MQNGIKAIPRWVLLSILLPKMCSLRKRSTEHLMLSAIMASYNTKALFCKYYVREPDKL